jgi:cytochrome c oxidase cbb3-type subunit 3
MADFVNEFWGVCIAVVTVASILGCLVLLLSVSKGKVRRDAQGRIETTGHTWDEDLGEYNNPLPRWWMWLFVITIVFGLGYLVLFPGLGAYQGTLGWSSRGEYQGEVKAAEAEFGPLFKQYASRDLRQVAADPQARAIGQRLFLNYCAQCHGSDARGGKGFPDLTDRDWLYGGTPEAIQMSILNGRNGVMPSMAAALGGDEDVKHVATYVMSLSGGNYDSYAVFMGKKKFGACAACHGADGKGNPALGAPNLTDKVWLHGGGVENVMETIRKGRNSVMPAHKDFLGEDKVHLLAAYVWSLSGETAATAASAAGTPAPAAPEAAPVATPQAPASTREPEKTSQSQAPRYAQAR